MPVLTTQPQEVVASPLTLYVAAIGSTPPLVNAVPASGTWTQVGVTGQNDYDSTGLTITHNQTYNSFQPVGTTAPITAWRVSEQITVSVTLADTSATAYALALNNVGVTTIAATTGAPGESDVPLLQGVTTNMFALLARGISALNQAMNMQYWIPAVYQSAAPAPVYKLGTPAELALTFSAVLDPNGNGFGKIQQMSANPT